MEIHQAAFAAWVPDFVRINNTLSGIQRDPTAEEVAAHRGLLAANALRVENLEMFVAHIAAGAHLRSEAAVGIGSSGLTVRVDPAADLATILVAARTTAATPKRLHRLYMLLHPFTDGNARSGRALLLWQIVRSAERGNDAKRQLGEILPALRSSALRAAIPLAH